MNLVIYGIETKEQIDAILKKLPDSLISNSRNYYHDGLGYPTKMFYIRDHSRYCNVSMQERSVVYLKSLRYYRNFKDKDFVHVKDFLNVNLNKIKKNYGHCNIRHTTRRTT